MFWSVWFSGCDSLKLFLIEGHCVVCPAVWCGHMTRSGSSDYWKSTVHVVDSELSFRRLFTLSASFVSEQYFRAVLQAWAAEERDKRVHRGRFWPTPRLWWPSHSSQRRSAAVCWSVFMLIWVSLYGWSSEVSIPAEIILRFSPSLFSSSAEESDSLHHLYASVLVNIDEVLLSHMHIFSNRKTEQKH